MTYLEVRDLQVRFGRRQAVAVDGVSFCLDKGERLGIIGESGSGKSVTCMAILGLLPEHAHVSGSIRLEGRELIGLPERHYRALRGNEISMIFQEPMTALDPTMRIGRQVGEVVAIHRAGEGPATHEIVLEWLERVGIQEPPRVANSYPHELSGGQRQRVLIAMALANRPGLVLCDEPTTALDVLVQRQVLDLLNSELAERASLFVSHDLAVVRHVCRQVAVMKDGQIVERGLIDEIIDDPQHSYTKKLIAAARLDEVQP